MAEPNAAINHAVAAIRSGQLGWQAAALEQSGRGGDDGLGARHARTFTRIIVHLSQRSNRRSTTMVACDSSIALKRYTASHRSISRTRRRDIGAFTTRKPRTEAVAFTPQQQRVHDALLAIQAAIYLRALGSGPLGFLMTTIRRQAASSLHGLVPFLETILTRRLSEIERVEIDDSAEEDAGHRNR